MEHTLNARKAAQILGVTVKTLQRWERKGKLIPVGRTESNRRRYAEAQLLGHMGRRRDPVATRTIVYFRVSSSAQRPEEMVQDLMTIVHCFSSRLYGLRNYRRQLNEALEQDHAAGAPHPA
jgi:predicted site-specific integrase-resolvase